MRTGTGRGFTVVETMAAMTVLGIGLVGVFGSLRVASSLAGQIREQETAQLLVERRMTSLLAVPIKQLGTETGQEGMFTWTQEIRPSKDPDVAEIVVMASWAHQGRQLRFQLVSLKGMDAGAT